MTFSFIILMHPTFTQEMSMDTPVGMKKYSQEPVLKHTTRDSFFLTGGHRWGIHLVSNIIWLEGGLQYFLRKNMALELGYYPLVIKSFSLDGLLLGINYYPVKEKTFIIPFFNSFYSFSYPFKGINPNLDNNSMLGFRIGIFINPKKIKLYLISRVGFIIGFIKETRVLKREYAPSLQFGIGLII